MKADGQELSLVARPITDQAELLKYGFAETAESPPPLGRSWMTSKLFIFIVIIPMVVGVFYNFIIATDRYASTAAYVVRESRSGTGLLSLVQSGMLTRSDDNSFAISEYVRSRDAVNELIEGEGLHEIFADESIDFFSRFPTVLSGDTREDLHRHFQHYVDVSFETSTGISTLTVQAFKPEDAHRLAQALLQGAETLINKLNARARADAVLFANELVEDATEKLKALQATMTDFRNTEELINPQSEVEILNRVMTDMLRALGETDAQLTQMLASAPDNPKVEQFRLRREALSKNIEEQRQRMAGSNESLARKIEGYETILLERELAEKSLVNAVSALTIARQEAQNGHLYLERVVQPNVPDKYGYPKRYLNVLLLFGMCLATFWIIRKTTELFSEDAG